VVLIQKGSKKSWVVKDETMSDKLIAIDGHEEPIENHSIPRIFFSKVGNQKLRTAIWSGVDNPRKT